MNGPADFSGPAESSKALSGPFCAAMLPKESGGLEGLRDPSPLCFDALRRYQVRGAASTVWRSGVEGLLVATAGARGVGACAIGWLAI